MPRTKKSPAIFTSPQMDLIDLFIGSEGTFGVITEVTVSLLCKKETISLVQFLDSDEQAIDLVYALRAEKRIHLNFLEFYVTV